MFLVGNEFGNLGPDQGKRCDHDIAVATETLRTTEKLECRGRPSQQESLRGSGLRPPSRRGRGQGNPYERERGKEGERERCKGESSG